MMKAGGTGDARGGPIRDARLKPTITAATKYREFAALLR
jgi:hypothetical protein